MRFSELRSKEIVNVCTGQRLGYVCLFGREPDFLIPLGSITRIGADIILVEIQGSCERSKRGRRSWF